MFFVLDSPNSYQIRLRPSEHAQLFHIFFAKKINSIYMEVGRQLRYVSVHLLTYNIRKYIKMTVYHLYSKVVTFSNIQYKIK